MNYRLGLENNVEGRSLAWVLGYPGCFAYGVDGEAAIIATAKAVRGYARWIESHGSTSPLDLEQINIILEETWDVYDIDQDYNRVEQGYSVNGWFLDDWKPLAEEEVHLGTKLLTWSREDLMEAVQGLSETRWREHQQEIAPSCTILAFVLHAIERVFGL